MSGKSSRWRMRPELRFAMLVAVETAVDSKLLDYRGARPEHRDRAQVRDRVFVYTGGWAYCEAGKLAGDHQLIPPVA